MFHSSQNSNAPRKRNKPSAQQWRYEALTGKINLGLDNHNAHVQPDGTYHYIISPDYPFVPRTFQGTPDPSFQKHRQPPQYPRHDRRP